jgi:hypothetical protein
MAKLHYMFGLATTILQHVRYTGQPCTNEQVTQLVHVVEFSCQQAAQQW